MENVRRYVSLAYIVLGLLVAWTLSRTLGLVLGLAGPGADSMVFADIRLSVILGSGLALAGVVYAWRSERIYGLSNEVAVELSRVTWPTWPESKRNTWLVIGFSIVMSVFLAVFDKIWQVLTDAILSV